MVGGGGRLGQQVVANLRARGEQVRVVVRDAERARRTLGNDAEVVGADVRSPAALRPALQGATVVVSAVHGFLDGRGAGPADVDERGNANLIDAARTAGADVVLVSVVGASPTSPADLFRAKFAAEQRLRASGVDWTIVRASAYLETWLHILTTTAGTSGRPLVFGRGNAPIAFVSTSDVAGVVADAATDPGLRSQLLEVAGSPLTMNELAGALQAARGWTGSVRHLPRPVLRAMSVLARPVRPAFARQNQMALAMDTGQLAGLAATPQPDSRTPRSLADVLATVSRTGS